MSVATPGVVIAPTGAVSVAAMPWSHGGQLRVTAIVKATFAFAPGAPMPLIDPEPIHSAEVHYQNNPTRSIRVTSDLCPFLPRADVILTGHAYAPPGETATRVVTRISLFGRHGVLLNKSLQIVGDRGASGVVPFRQLPITYERAHGGIGHRDNPLGIGAGSDDRQPNIVDPLGPERVAGYGPISRLWHARRSLLSPDQRGALARPIAELVGEFDLRYFQSAPLDQRIDYLQGDEWLGLEGLHPSLVRFRTQLPGARAAARFYKHGQAGDEGTLVWLDADTLRIDTDSQRCSLTFRGSIEVRDERALMGLWLAGALSVSGSALSWPAEPPAVTAMTESPKPQNPRVPLPSGTVEISDEDSTTLAQAPPVKRAGDAPPERCPLPSPSEAAESTFQLTPEDQQAASRRLALPFERDAQPSGEQKK